MKKHQTLTIFLIKDNVKNLKECLKNPYEGFITPLNPIWNMEGLVQYGSTHSREPMWKNFLGFFSKDSINIPNNTSNKAIMLIKVQGRIMAMVFGYGRSFLKEESIEKNFGLKVALNIINPDKMRSINVAMIENTVITTQRQTSYGTSQDDFGISVTSDILKGITGKPSDKIYGRSVSGKDALRISVCISPDELNSKLKLYLSAYKMDRYKEIGFEWVDNISEIKDPILVKNLTDDLIYAIKNKKIEHLNIAPPETINWDSIVGFCYSGIGKKTDDQDNYKFDLDIIEYIDKIKPEANIYKKLKRDHLHAIDSDGNHCQICNIYSALTFQTRYDNNHYILYSDNWYRIQSNFFEKVNTYITDNVPISAISFPDCPQGIAEEEYNKMVANSNPSYSLLDRKLVSVSGGPKKIEACDIFTSNKQFIHVKNKKHSAQISHLFAQGRVSAECFVSDESFRKQIHDIISKDLGMQVFDYKIKPSPHEYEVVFAIIDDKKSNLIDKLPFFSKVTLMVTAQSLSRMNYKYSVLLINKN